MPFQNRLEKTDTLNKTCSNDHDGMKTNISSSLSSQEYAQFLFVIKIRGITNKSEIFLELGLPKSTEPPMRLKQPKSA